MRYDYLRRAMITRRSDAAVPVHRGLADNPPKRVCLQRTVVNELAQGKEWQLFGLPAKTTGVVFWPDNRRRRFLTDAKGGDVMNHRGAAFINLERYPIHLDGPQRDAVLAGVRRDLAQDGCAVLKGFLTRDGIAALTQEADRVAHKGHKSFNRTNAYFTKDDPSLPDDDPRRQFFDRSNAFIPADNFARDGALRSVHDFPGFDAFIQDCLQEEHVHRYADPLADVIVNMADAGNGFPWHFDTNNFTVTLAIQNAESGGAFEYAAGIREGDENFAEVARVLNGTSDKITVLELEPGDLQLFRGRYSLHRVAPLQGNRPRYVAIFSYVEEPGMVGSPERTQQLYGRTLPIHWERAGQRSDAYID